MNDIKDKRPPDYILRFLNWICPEHLLEEIEGDLIQRFSRDLKAFGEPKAKRRLMWSALRFLRPGIILRNRYNANFFNMNLIRNYITIALRNFARQKSFTLLNVIGLSLGMTASLLIIQYVKYERSFDRFHSRADDIYRIQYNGWKGGELNFESAVAVPAASAALKSNFPEVEAYTRFLPAGGVLTYEKAGQEPVTFREDRAQFADTAIFKVFDFRLIKGDPETCLKGTNKIIISERTAEKYFRDEEPIGKRLVDHGNDDRVFEITGVFEDVPENSHIKFDLLISYETINAMTNNESETSWGWYDFYSFILLKPGTDVKALQAKWDDWLATNRKKEFGENKQEFILRPLTDIHLYSNLMYETSPEELRDGDSVYALSVVSVFILIIAWVNYVNLATARSFTRANEVGVRKVVGAFRGQLISQFFTESIMLNLFSAALAISLVILAWPSFSRLTGWDIPIDFIFQKEFWTLVGAMFIFGTIISGFYPAIILSSFKPVAVLKGKIMRSSSGNVLRKGLVVFQFVASVFLISGSLIVYQQLEYMKNKDLGADINQTVVLQGPGVIDSLYERNYETFKTEVLKIPGIRSITSSTSIPGKENYWTRNVGRLGDDPKTTMIITHAGIDHDFIPQYRIKVLAGRNFDKDFPDDNSRILINESLSRMLRFKDPELAIGERVVSGRDTLEIAGVVADFHQMSLKAKVIPVAYRLFYNPSFYSLKLETKNYEAVLEAIEGPWNTIFPGNPIDYFFLDEFFNRQYDTEDRFGQVVTVFTVLTIFIASLGLLGLASFMASQRTKEIGIRKALGATATGIVGLLTRGFLKPVFLAVVIAFPLGWWLMDLWLQSFPYRTTVNAWVFLLSGLLVLVIAFVSVSSQTLKAAMTKPAETLKYE